MSDEPEDLIEKVFVTEHGAKYPFVKAQKIKELYAIPHWPCVFVLDADGLVYSGGKDGGMPSEQVIEELLANVSLAPKLPKEPRYDALRSMWDKRDHGKLRDYLDKMLAQPNLDAQMREVFEAQKAELGKKVEAQGKRIERLAAGPDYAASEGQLERIMKEWKGFPPEAAAKKELDRFATDATIKKELAAGKALQKLVAAHDTSKSAQVRKLVDELAKFRKKYVGTHASKQAEEMMGRLRG